MTEKHKGGRGKKSDFRLAVEAMEVGQEQWFVGRTYEGASPILRDICKRQNKCFASHKVDGGICVIRRPDFELVGAVV